MEHVKNEAGLVRNVPIVTFQLYQIETVADTFQLFVVDCICDHVSRSICVGDRVE